MKVAIIGAGISGLSAAKLLLEKRSDVQIELFEEKSVLGGRMTSRTAEGLPTSFDLGCQFISLDRPSVSDFFFRFCADGERRELPQPIICLPEGFIVEQEGRYFLRSGMNSWCEKICREIEREGDRFKLHLNSTIQSLDDLESRGFEAIFSSAPGPRAKALGSQRSVEYHACLTLCFSWHSAPKEALEYYAYRDISDRSGITWLAHEGLKREQPGVWIAQLSPELSSELKEKDETFLEDFIEEDLTEWIPVFEEGDKTLIDRQYWPEAFPIQFNEPSAEESFEYQKFDSTHIYHFGDGYRGVGRVENAIESAIAAVSHLCFDLESKS